MVGPGEHRARGGEHGRRRDVLRRRARRAAVGGGLARLAPRVGRARRRARALLPRDRLGGQHAAARAALEPQGLREQRGRAHTGDGRRLDWRPVVIFSGIQPTGRKHIGNYIGAIRGYLDGQERGDPAIYCMVDLHATSVAYDASALPGYVLDTTAMMIASGLDPERCIMFRQSDVAAHSELCWLLCAVTAYGDLQRMHQFTGQSAREQELVRTSLFLYPVLQAADILAYRTDEVPVGEDQRQHIELSREIARRFNSTYGEVLVEPEAVIPTVGGRVMDLQDPESKMSTTYSSEQGIVYIDEEPDAIRRKLKRAQTDSGTEIVRRPDKPGVTNLIEMYAVARGIEPEAVEREFEGQGYGAFKQAVGEALVEMLAPVRERYLELRRDEAGLESALAAGAERAREIADP